MHCWVTVTAPSASYDILISESLCFFLKLHVLQSEPGHLPEVGQLGHPHGHLRDLQSLRILQQEHPQLCVQRLVQIYAVKRISSISVDLAYHNLSYSKMNLARQSVQAPLGGCYTGLVTLAASRQFTLKIFFYLNSVKDFFQSLDNSFAGGVCSHSLRNLERQD